MCVLQRGTSVENAISLMLIYQAYLGIEPLTRSDALNATNSRLKEETIYARYEI